MLQRLPRHAAFVTIEVMKITFVSLILAFALSFCHKDETITGLTTDAEIWQLTQMNGVEITAPITLNFPEKGKIAGAGPCNRYFADQTAPLPWFEAKTIGATRMACPDLKLEGDYFKALSSMTLIERKGDTLLLSNEDGGALEFHLK